MNEFEPTPQQKEILDWQKNAVVVAGPGSGKTWTLAKKVQRVIEECRDYQGIAAISYTNKASKELEQRAKQLCKKTKQSFFGTIDSFCSTEIVLSFGKKYLGYPPERVLIEKVQGEKQVKRIREIKGSIINIIERYSELTIQQIHEKGICVYNELDEEDRLYLQERFMGGYFDLNLIGGVANLILMSSKVCANYLKAKYRYIFIDEFQDSDFEQFSLFKRCSELGINSWAVGDFNQSIYSFKMGNPKYMEELIGMKSFERFDMNINHRCHPFIQAYADLFLSLQKNENPNSIPEGESRIVKIPIKGTQNEIGKWININLRQAISMADVQKKSNIVLLGRSHETLEMVSDMLKIPHRYHRKLLLDDDRSLGGDILKQLLMITFNPKGHSCIEFIDFYFLNPRHRDVADIKTRVKEFSYLFTNNLMHNDHYKQIEEKFIEIVNMVNLDYQLKKYTIEALRQLMYSPHLCDNFKPFKDSEIQLMTIHSSKGLEFDIVFHLDLYEDTFPDYRSKGDAIKEREDINLHYIALTRAKKYVFLLVNSRKRAFSKRYGKYYEHDKEPSPYIIGAIERYQLSSLDS
ncbi:UvrD-helicase domain-containing protein [Bacillus cereus]